MIYKHTDGWASFAMKLIKLQGINCLYVFVDDDDFDTLSKSKWYFLKDKNTMYANSSLMKRMHRIILNIQNPKIIVDHFDGNGLNNIKSNLRICNLNQNNANRKPSKNKSTEYLGVYKIKNKFLASSRSNGKLKSSRYFNTEYEAVLAYNKLAVKNHGEFARLNIYKKTKNETI